MKEIPRGHEASAEEMAEWRKAADTWRLPYWDWTTERVLEAVRMGQVDLVPMPGGQAEKVIPKLDNPLRKFTNPSLKPMGDPSMGKFALHPHNDPNYGTYPV